MLCDGTASPAMGTRHSPPTPSPDPGQMGDTERPGGGCGRVGCASPSATGDGSVVLCLRPVHSQGFSAGFLTGTTRGQRRRRARAGMEKTGLEWEAGTCPAKTGAIDGGGRSRAPVESNSRQTAPRRLRWRIQRSECRMHVLDIGNIAET